MSLPTPLSEPSTSHSVLAPTSRPCSKDSRATPARLPTGATWSRGEVVVSYTDGTEESNVVNNLFYWPPGHSVRVVEDAEIIMFSPQVEHGAVMDHMLARMTG